jgi:hypothetical protein
VIDEILIYLTDVLVALQEYLVGAPEIVDLIALLAVDDGFEDGGVGLGVNSFLIGLNGENEVYLRRSDIVGEVRQIYGLDRIKKDEERENSFVSMLFFWSERSAVKHAGIILESRNLFRDPKIANHDLVEGLGPGVFGGIQVEKASSGSFDDGAVRLYRVISFGD